MACQRAMETKYPKGIFILVLFIFITSLSSIKYLLSEGKVIFFSSLLQGPVYQLYYLGIISLGVITAIGLFLLKKWAFFIFLAKNVFFALMFVVNSLFVTKDILLKLGWKDIENLLTLYRVTMIIAIFFCAAFTSWILYYKKYFLKPYGMQTGN